MANEVEKLLLADSQAPTPAETTPEEPRPQTGPRAGNTIEEANREAAAVDRVLANPSIGNLEAPGSEVFYGNSSDYFTRGVKAGVQQVKSSFSGLAAMGNLIIGDETAAKRRLSEVDDYNERISNILEPLEGYEEFLTEPTLQGAINQGLRAIGQAAAPAGLVLGEALAGGIILGAGRTAFTSAGRAALQDVMTKTVRKTRGLKDRVLYPDKDEVLTLGGPTVDPRGQTVNAFEELWFKTLRNKGVDNLTPEDKVVMDTARKYLRDIRIGGISGAVLASEQMIAPEILQEYRDAGVELGATEALLAGLIGLPAAGIDVLSEYVFFGSLFKLAAGRSRLAATRQKYADGKKLSDHEKFILQLSDFAERKGLDAIGRRGKAELRLFEKRSTLALLSDIGRVTAGSMAAEGITEGLQEEIIMSVGAATNPDFDIQGIEANLRRAQAFFDGAMAGAARGAIGGAGAAIFQKARTAINNKVEDLAWQNVQQENYQNLADFGLPETREDVKGQLETMIDPDFKRESVWLTQEFLQANGVIDENGRVNKTILKELLQEAFGDRPESSIPEIMLSIDKDGFGALLTVSKDARDYYVNKRIEGRTPLRDVLANILDFTETPASSTGDDVIVQLLENDRVVWEQTTPFEDLPEVVIKADEQYKPDEKYSVMKNSMDPEVVKELIGEEDLPAQADLFDPTPTLQAIEDIELEIFNYTTNDQEVPQALLDQYDKLRKQVRDIKIAITTPENEGERRLESYRDDDSEEEVKRRNMEYSNEFDDNYNETLEELKNRMEQEGGYTDESFGDVVEGSQFDFAQQFEDIGKITVQQGRVTSAWKRRDFVNLEKEKDNQALREEIARYYRQSTEALIRLTTVYPVQDNDKQELSRINETLINLNTEIGKGRAQLSQANNSNMAKAIKRIRNRIINNDMVSNPTKAQRTLEDPNYDRKANSKVFLAEFLDRTRFTESELRAFFKSSKTLNKRLQALEARKTELLEEQRKLFLALQKLPEKTFADQTKRGATERLILGDLGVPPKKAAEIARSNSTDFLIKLDQYTQQLSDRVIGAPEIRVVEAGDKLPQIGETAKENILKAIADEEDRIDAIAEGIDETDVRQLATERVLARTEVDGLPLKSFLGMFDTPQKSAAKMSEYLDVGELSFVDEEVLRNANTAILKRINTLQEEDPNSVYRIVPTDVIKRVAKGNETVLIDKEVRPIVAEFFDLLSEDNKFSGVVRPSEIDLFNFVKYVREIKNLLKTQGGKDQIAPFVVIEQKFGKDIARGFREFVKLAGPALGITIDSGYQSIIKESTPETEPDLYADKFAGLSPTEAVQESVTTASQLMNNLLTQKDSTGRTEFERSDVRALGQNYKLPGKNTLKFGWYLRAKDQPDQPLSFNEILNAGRAILETNMDSVEKSTTELRFRTALGFSILATKYFPNFRNKNGDPRKIVFKYHRGKKLPAGEVVIESLDQPLPDDLLQYLNPHTDLNYFNGATLSTLSLRKLATATSPKQLLDELRAKKEFEVDSTAEIRASLPKTEAERSADILTMQTLGLPPKTKTTNLRTFDIFNLPLYYNNAKGAYESAKDMVSDFKQSPFYYSSDGNPKGRPSRPNLIKSILDARKKLLDPSLDILKDKEEGLAIPSYASQLELDSAIRNRFLAENAVRMKDVMDYAAISDYVDFSKLNIKEIITGGQIGVDLIAERVAREVGFPTITLAGTNYPFKPDRPDLYRTEYKKLEILFQDFAKEGDQNLNAIKEQRDQLQTLIDETEAGKTKIREKKGGVKLNAPKVQYAPLNNIPKLEKQGKGINVMRKRNTNEHYGNPFSHLKQKTAAEISVDTIDEAVASYRDWILNKRHQKVRPEQRKWIQDQLSAGALDGQSLLYYDKGSKSKNHANVLKDIVVRRQQQKGVKVDLDEELENLGSVAQPLREFPGYNPRTEVNVRYSDGVIIFADNSKGALTPGSHLTKRLAETFNKPVLINPKTVVEMQTWAIQNNVEKLMIAGSGRAEPSYRKGRTKDLQEQQIQEIEDRLNIKRVTSQYGVNINNTRETEKLLRNEAEKIYATQETGLERMEQNKEIKRLKKVEVMAMNSVTPDWEKLFQNFMVSTNYFRTHDNLKKQLQNKIMNDPTNFAVNIPPEKEYEILQEMLQEENILNDDDYAQNVEKFTDLFTDPKKIDQGFTEIPTFDTDEDPQFLDPFRTKGNKSFTEIVKMQNINGEKYEGRFVLEGITPDIFIQDDVTNAYADVIREDGRGVARQILNLRRKKYTEDGLTPEEQNLLNDLQRQQPFAFKRAGQLIPEDVLTLRRRRAQEANFDLAKVGRIVDPIRILTDRAKETLGLQNRSMFVMFEDNPIRFDSPKYNQEVEISRKAMRENPGLPEQIVTIGNVDLVVLRRPDDYFYKIRKDKTLGKDLIVDEVEGVILASYEHALGHAYFHEWYDLKVMESTEEGKKLLEAFEKVKKLDKSPYNTPYGLEEFVGDQMAKLQLTLATKAQTTPEERYTRSLVLKLRQYYKQTKNTFTRQVLGRATGTPMKEFVDYHNAIAEQFKGTYKDRGSGKQLAIEFARDLADEQVKRRDMKFEDFTNKLKKAAQGDEPDAPKTYIKKFNNLLNKLASSNIRYLKKSGVNPRLTNQLFRETQEEGVTETGHVQENINQFNRIINSTFIELNKTLGIRIGGFTDDNLIHEEDRRIINKALDKAAEAIEAFTMPELVKQMNDPNYQTKERTVQKSMQMPDGTVKPTGPPIDIQQGRADRMFQGYGESIYVIVDILERMKRLMEGAGVRTRENYDMRRNYNMDAIMNDDMLRARLVVLLQKYNEHTGLTQEEAEKAVRIMIKNREDNDNILLDDQELDPLVSSVAVGMSPKRARLFENIPTARLRANGLLEDPLDAFTHAIRSMSLKFVYNNKVNHVLSDQEILRARFLLAGKEIETEDGYTNDLRFLEPFAKLATREEQFNEFGGVDEAFYFMRGHMSATASIWLDPNVKKPFDTSYALSAMLGKAGMEINRYPILRNFQAGLMLLNQVTFLTGSAISSIPELAGPVIQRGDIESVGFLGKAIVRNLKNKEEATNLMRAIGVMGISQTLEASVYAGDLGWATNKTQQWSQRYFRSILVTKLMGFFNRNAGLVSIMAIEADAKRAVTGDAKSIERLGTIGLADIPPQDLVAAMDRLGVMKSDTPKSFTEIDKFFRSDPLGLKIRNGLELLSGEMTLRPNSAQRTVWMNNPFYALISQLKPFYYSFGKTYGEGTWKNMKRNYKYDGPVSALLPLILILATMMPLAMLALEIREYIKYVAKGGDPEVFRSDEMPFGQYMLDVADRAGLPGRFGLLIPMFEADLYGDAFFTPLLGATFERTVDIIEGTGNIWDYVPYLGAVGYK